MTIAQQLEQKGLEKGRIEGRQEGKIEVARNLMAKGIPHESVRELNGLLDDDLAKNSPLIQSRIIKSLSMN